MRANELIKEDWWQDLPQNCYTLMGYEEEEEGEEDEQQSRQIRKWLDQLTKH